MAEVTVPQIIPPIEPIKSPLALDEASMNVFLSHMHRRRHPARTDVFRPGDPANTLFYVTSGSLSIITEEPDGRELVLGYINQGEFIGELGLFYKTDKREVVLRTKTPCELAEIGYEQLQDFFPGRWPKSVRKSFTPSAHRYPSVCWIPAEKPAGWPIWTSPTASCAPCTTCARSRMRYRIRKAARYGFHARNWRASPAARGKWPGAC